MLMCFYDLTSFLFSEESYWRFRAMHIVISIEGEFISHCVESGIDLRFNDALSAFEFVLHSNGNLIGESGASSLSSALRVNSSLTSLDLRMNLNSNYTICFCVFLIFDKQNWRIRSIFIVIGTGGQFISH